MMIEFSFLTAFFLPITSSTRSAISAGRQIGSKVDGSLRLDRMDSLGACCGSKQGMLNTKWWCLLLLIKKYCVFSALVGGGGDGKLMARSVIQSEINLR